MEAEVAVARLDATGRKQSTSVRCVGYAILIQELGWDGVGEQMKEEALRGLRGAFEEAGVDPFEITYPDGGNEYLAEVVRSSMHPASKAAAKALMEDDPSSST